VGTASTRATKSCPGFEGETALLVERECIYARAFARVADESDPTSGIDVSGTTAGVLYGGQREFADGWFVGGVVGHGVTETSGQGGAYDESASHYSAGLAVKRVFSGRTTLSGSTAYAFVDREGERIVPAPLAAPGTTASASEAVHVVAAKARVSTIADLGRFYMKPMVDADLVYTRSEGFTEAGAGPLSLRLDPDDEIDLGVLPALEIGARVNLDQAVLRAYASAGVRYWYDASAARSGHLVGADVPLGFESAFQANDLSATGTIGAEVVMSDTLGLRMEYNIAGHEDAVHHDISGRLDIRF
jgi:hypothetical protein